MKQSLELRCEAPDLGLAFTWAELDGGDTADADDVLGAWKDARAACDNPLAVIGIARALLAERTLARNRRAAKERAAAEEALEREVDAWRVKEEEAVAARAAASGVFTVLDRELVEEIAAGFRQTNRITKAQLAAELLRVVDLLVAMRKERDEAIDPEALAGLGAGWPIPEVKVAPLARVLLMLD